MSHHTHEKPFTDPHSDPITQLAGKSSFIADSPEVTRARNADTPRGIAALGKALARQLRYREALDVYNAGLEIWPEDEELLRLRAGRYLTTLQADRAAQEFGKLLENGADELDCRYRIGLAQYYRRDYGKAMEQLELCMPLCEDNDEMGIAVIYWHTLSALRAAKRPKLLDFYREGMDVGHHIGYEKAMAVCAGKREKEDVIATLDNGHDPLEYSIALYGIHILGTYGLNDGNSLLDEILRHEEFWISFAWLAAWNDRHRPE